MRTENRVAVAAVVLLTLAIVWIESLGPTVNALDPRRSTFLHGPEGAAGLASTLRELGVRTESQRRRVSTLAERPESTSARTLFAVIDPFVPLDNAEGIRLADWPRAHGDLLLAGPGSDAAMACFGYRARSRGKDSVAARAPGDRTGPAIRVATMLGRDLAGEVVDSGGSALQLSRCTVPTIATTDTLLTTPTGRAVALRLHPAGYTGTVTLVGDGRIFSNKILRDPDTGVLIVGFLLGRDTLVVFDERHQGFEPEGSLLSASLAWSAAAPLGWALWQLILVGLLALLFGAIRFGAPRPINDRQRRSALEHVTALATALSAANGHETAIRLLIRGLARRLVPDRRQTFDEREWLTRLRHAVRTPRGRSALATLQSLTTPGQPADAVLRAANAVEDVWQDLRP